MNTRIVRGLGAVVGLFLAAACGGSGSSSGDAAAGHGGSGGATRTGGAGGSTAPGGSGGGGGGAGGTASPRDGSAGSGGSDTSTAGTGGRDASMGGAGGRDASTVGAGGRDASMGGAGGRDASGSADLAGGGDGAPSGGAGGSLDGGTAGVDGGCGTGGGAPAVTRGGQYFGFAERFNRYYTDCAWQPSSTVYVSPTGTGNGSARTSPASVSSALAGAVPGRMIVFLAGTYAGCYELDSDRGGTYDSPIVLLAERNVDGSPGAIVNCCGSGRRTCFNLEAADYVAVDGFELVGGDYGVRAVGAGFAANEHQKGVAVLGNVGHGQNKDPFFTGHSDWFVIERSVGYDSGSGDGHAIYLSNGSDFNVVRWNESYNTVSSDFQINADPNFTCGDEGIAFDDPECDAVAGSHPTGGRGASDFMLVEGNFFHHSKAQGPNFTSVRNSTIKNNVFALPERHGASFWQETDNPKLGSSNNFVAHNLFITKTANRQAIGITNDSTGNRLVNNVVVTVSISGTTVSATASGQLLATDATTVAANTFEHNAWISGFFGSDDAAEPYVPNATELRLTTFQASWFTAFPTTLARDAAGFAPTATAPWLDLGLLLPEVPIDRAGGLRKTPTDLGPFER